MKRTSKLYYVLMITLMILAIFSIINNIKSDRIVKVLNHYNEVDKIVIIKGENKHEITGSNLDDYKNALEPRNIISTKHGKEITQNLENKIFDIEYYIQDKKLFKSSIYSLYDILTDDFKSYYFELNDKVYTMIVNNEFRSVNKVDRTFLLEYLE